MDRKGEIKSIRRLIDEKQFSDAAIKCKELLADEEDYTLLLFLGLCQSELLDALAAKGTFLRAVASSDGKVQPYQGLYKLYSTGQVDFDAAFLDVLNALKSRCDDAAKLRGYQVVEFRALLHLDMFDQSRLLYDAADDGTLKAALADVLVQRFLSPLRSPPRALSAAVSHAVRSLDYAPLVDGAVSKRWLLHWLSTGGPDEWTAEGRAAAQSAAQPPDARTLVRLGVVVAGFQDETVPVGADDDVASAVTDGDWETALETAESASASNHSADQLLLALLRVRLAGQNADGDSLLRDGRTALQILAQVDNARLAGCTRRVVHLLATALIDQCDFSGCLSLLADNCDRQTDDEVRLLKVRALVGLNDIAGAKVVLADFADESSSTYLAASAWLRLHEGDLGCAASAARSALSAEQHDYWLHYLMGRVCWRQPSGDRAVALRSFLAAAKLNAHHADSFYYLGLHYAADAAARGRAVRCLERAHTLQPRRADIGRALSDVYARDAVDVTEKQLTLLRSFSEAGEGWALQRLSVHLLAAECFDEAVQALQRLTGLQPLSATAWHALADAYLARGSHESAEKSYQVVLDLDPCSYHALLQIATICLQTNRPVETIELCRRVHVEGVWSAPLKAVQAQAHLQRAVNCWHAARYCRSLDEALRAAQLGAELAASDGDVSIGHKLLGDACVRLARFDDALLEHHAVDAVVAAAERVTLQREPLLRRAVCAYGRALVLRRGAASAWHDVGLAAALLARCTADAPLAFAATDRAQRCLRRALSVDGACSAGWLTLGALAAVELRRPELAQHCFVRCLQLERSNARAWTSLGLLYVQHGDDQMANAVLAQAQSADPSLATAWCTQAIIAERNGHDAAMDLFRHCCQIGNETVSALGYAYHVLTAVRARCFATDAAKLDYEIDGMHAVAVARDSLQHNPHAQRSTTGQSFLSLLCQLDGLSGGGADSPLRSDPMSALAARDLQSSLAAFAVAAKQAAEQTERNHATASARCCVAFLSPAVAAQHESTPLDDVFAVTVDRLSRLTVAQSAGECRQVLSRLQSASTCDLLLCLRVIEANPAVRMEKSLALWLLHQWPYVEAMQNHFLTVTATVPSVAISDAFSLANSLLCDKRRRSALLRLLHRYPYKLSLDGYGAILKLLAV